MVSSQRGKNVNYYIVDIKMAVDQEIQIVKPIGASTTYRGFVK